MKKINLSFLMLTASIFFLPQKLNSKDVSLKQSTLSFYIDSNNTFGLNIKNPFGEFHYACQEEKYNFGITATSEKFSLFPVTFRTGHLSTTGSLSRLNSPLLSSTVSPFSTGFSEAACITTSLPGNSSFSKPVTLFFQSAVSPKSSTINSIKINSLYDPQNCQLAFSGLGTFQFFQKKLKIKTSVTTGFFSYQENTFSSWFSNELYYPQGNHFCSLYQNTLQYKAVSSTVSAGVYETPFSAWSYILRADNKLNLNKFGFNISVLYNPNTYKDSVLTSSGKTLSDTLQLKNGIQYKFTTGRSFPVLIKTGIQNFLNINLSQNQHPVKIAAGLQLTTPFYAASLTASAGFNCNSSYISNMTLLFDKAAVQFKNTFYFQFAVPSFTYNFTFDPSDDYSSISTVNKFNISLYYLNQSKISSNCSLTVNGKDKECTEKKISFGITSKFMYKQINITLKFSADNTF